ncbi:hypothetical protein [Alistipes sp.]|uniref:hypothetical protein n=1 Tax=Alistipes sp. TaxID=1872444 RepID=UPI003AB8B750
MVFTISRFTIDSSGKRIEHADGIISVGSAFPSEIAMDERLCLRPDFPFAPVTKLVIVFLFLCYY